MNLEYVMSCDVCCVEFDEDLTVPKILDCGHSFCLFCIEKLVQSNLSCPKCRKELNANKSVNDYPTNYLVLDSLKLVKLLQNNLESFQIMKNKIEEKKEILMKKISHISIDLEEAKQDLEQLEDLADPDTQKLDLKKVKYVLDKLERKFKMDDVILSDFKKLRGTVNIHIADFETPDEFLAVIYNRLKKDEKIYTVKNVDEVVKYGKVSLENNIILFHALSETEKPHQASLIWFDDLKKCATEVNFFTFLKLSCNEKEIIHLVTIKMLDNQLASQFITLCTGECGPTYKNCRYGKYDDRPDDLNYCRVIKLLDNEVSQTTTESRIDYNTKKQNNIMVYEDDQIFHLRDDGQFFVNKIMCSSDISSVSAGIVESPKNINDFISFNDDSKLIIVDCGILIKF